LVTGAAGQVGREVVGALQRRGGHVEVAACGRAELDLSDRDSVLGAICSTRPDVVFHVGAFTAVDRCESEAATAYRVNALGTRHVAEACRRIDAHLLYVSTDYVFDGTKAEPYLEWDAPRPRSVYGRSKLGGEQECGPDATIVRTSWVCGRHGPNMVKTVLRVAAEPGELRFVDDQRGCPTFADDLAGMLVRLGVERRPGIFHVTNQGAVSWYEFVRAVMAAAGHDPGRVVPITSGELDPPRPAPRPANSVLANLALELSGIPLLDHFEVPLQRLVAALGS
jgi:dTDP-4-dehydrorhamnose reductase